MRKDGEMNKTTTLSDLVQQECCNLVSDECIGTNVNGGSLKRNSKTTIIYQYPYELVFANAGKCWVLEGIPCDYFERQVLPLAKRKKGHSAIVEEYRERCRSIEMHEPKFCMCGREIDSNERKCTVCKATTRRLRNKRFRRVG